MRSLPVTFGTAKRGMGGPQNGQCRSTNHQSLCNGPLLSCSDFNVPMKGLKPRQRKTAEQTDDILTDMSYPCLCAYILINI